MLERPGAGAPLVKTDETGSVSVFPFFLEAPPLPGVTAGPSVARLAYKGLCCPVLIKDRKTTGKC